MCACERVPVIEMYFSWMTVLMNVGVKVHYQRHSALTTQAYGCMTILIYIHVKITTEPYYVKCCFVI